MINDTDTGMNGSYHLTSPSLPSPLFSLSPQGIISLNHSLRGHHNVMMYNFTVVAIDSGSPPLSSNTTVIITVLPSDSLSPLTNEGPLIFEQASYNVSVFENKAPGTHIVTPSLSINNSYRSDIQYTISGSESALSHLIIHPFTGQLITLLPIDRERYPSLTVHIQAKSRTNTSLYAMTTVYVTILDVIDHTPLIISDHTLQLSLPVVPNVPLHTVRAITQDDSALINYQLINNDGIFIINPYTGILTTPILINAGTYKLNISASVSNMIAMTTLNVVVMETDSTPRLRPTSIYVSTFNYLLPPLLKLTDFNNTSGRDLILNDSPCKSQRYFQLNESGLYLMNIIKSGQYILNISVGVSQGVWSHQEVKVHVNLLSNHTLDHTLFLMLPNLNLSDFIEYLMSPLLTSLSSIINCRYDCLDVATLRQNGQSLNVGMSVRKPDLVSYYTQTELRNLIEPYERVLTESINWTIYVSTDMCSGVQCNGFSICSPSLSYSLPHTVVTSLSSLLLSLPYTPSYSCTCPPGYSSDCTIELNECSPNPCQYGAQCIDLLNDYQCKCPIYTSGKNCSSVCPAQTTCELCSPNPCLNGGSCQIQGGQGVCRECPLEYSGPHCELTTVHIEGEGGYVMVDGLERRKDMELSLEFAGVQPNALLLYTGNSLLSVYLLASV